MSVKVLVILISLTVAYVHSGAITHCPSYPGVGVLKLGESKAVHGQCAIAACHHHFNKGIFLKRCAEIVAEPPCNIVDGNKAAPYPDCCPQASCPER